MRELGEGVLPKKYLLEAALRKGDSGIFLASSPGKSFRGEDLDKCYTFAGRWGFSVFKKDLIIDLKICWFRNFL